MTRSWTRPVFALPLALALFAQPAHAGLVETALLTEQSTRMIPGVGGVTGPAWSPTVNDPAPQAPSSGGGLFGNYRASQQSTRARKGKAVERVARPASGAPGSVAGLVYEFGTKAPQAGVNVMLVSLEPEYVETILTARTDAAGYYEFKAVEPGAWKLSVQRDGLPATWALPRKTPIMTVAKKEKVAVPAFELHKQACVAGKAVWSDGYTLFDAPLTVVPANAGYGLAGGLLNGIGDYQVCEAPEDSAMVWMHLRDGRSLGRSTRLAAGTTPRVDFTPDPIEKMEGSPLRVLPVLADGRPVPRAQIVVVGRRFEQGTRPALVFVREEATDADGVAEFKVPFGNYEVLVMNPREGETGSARMVVDLDQTGNVAPLKVELVGKTTAEDRTAMKRKLLERAEQSLVIWTQ